MSLDLEGVALQTVIAEQVSAPITREALARYAEASGDRNPLHLDPAFARRAGFDDVIAHGMLGMAMLGHLLTASFPAHAHRSFGARFTAVIPVGSRLRCRARLSEIGHGEARLALEALIDGSETVAISGSATVALATGR
jgi:acyl dehydratase